MKSFAINTLVFRALWVLAVFLLGGLLLVAGVTAWTAFAPAPNLGPDEVTKPTFTLDGLNGQAKCIAFGQKGDQLSLAVFVRDKGVVVWDVPTQKRALALAARGDSVRYSPDCKSLLVGDDKGQLRDASTGEPLRSFGIYLSGHIRAEFSADGRRVAFAGLTHSTKPDQGPKDDDPPGVKRKPVLVGAVQVYDVQSGEKLFGTEMDQTGTPDSLSFSPDAKRLAVGASGRVFVWDLKSDKPQISLPRSSWPQYAVFTHDGKWLATTDNKGADIQPREICVCDAQTGQERFRLGGHEGWVHGLTFSADGRYLVSVGADGKVKVWDLPGRRLVLTLSGPSEPFYSVAVSPNNKYIAAGLGDVDTNGKVCVWDVSKYLAP